MTKDDVQAIKNIVEEAIAPLKADVGTLKTDVSSLTSRVFKIELALEKTVSKSDLEQFRSDLFTKVDSLLKEARDYRDEQSVHQVQHDRVNERVAELEKIHPQGQHLPQ